MIDFVFDLQRFKGNTTVENKYEPTEHELEGQRIAANYAGAVSPNALKLNDYAAQVLGAAFPNVINGADQMYTNLLLDSRARQNAALDSMGQVGSSTNQMVNYINDELLNLAGSRRNRG